MLDDKRILKVALLLYYNKRKKNTASLNTLQFLRQSLSKGFIEIQNQKIDLRHSIIIMSGDFKPAAQNTLRFAENQTYEQLLEKQLGKEFMEIFDEIFCFEALDENAKLSILRQETKNWRRIPDMTMLKNALSQTDTLTHALKMLRFGMIHSN